MQKEISNRVFLDQATSSLGNVCLSSAIDRTASDYEAYDADIARYIPGVPKLVFQGMLEDIKIKEKAANASYKVMEQLDF